mmetsp:Transcript_61137/g.85041  ORF Transcript_61137/g.85041 Transcript_61137/m.85041 type:complete len:340 (-) Transcript_61137:344-1363(-)
MALNVAVILIVSIIIFVFVGFYKRDLTKEQLTDRGYVNPSSSKFVKLSNGAEMHYRDEGNINKPVLVMIHGGFGSLQNWEGWICPLQDDYRLISMDLLGHGLTGGYPDKVYTRYTNRDAIHELLVDILNVTKYTAVGNSFGGGIALEIALQYPTEVEGLVLVDSEGIPNGENGYDVSQFGVSAEEIAHPGEPEYTNLSFLERLGSKFIGPTVVRTMLESMIHNQDLITKDFVKFHSDILRYEGTREAQILMFRQGLALIATNDPMDLLPRLKELKMPVLIMQGREDTLVPMRVAETFEANIETNDLVVVDEAGHMPMIEKPNETAKMVDDFMKKYQIGE